MELAPRWRKVVRDLMVNKTRTLLVVMAIAVGVFAIGVVSGTQVMLGHDLNTRYAQTNPASAIIFTAEPFDDALVQTISKVEGVQAVVGRRSVMGRIQVGADEWRDLRLDAYGDFQDIPLNKIMPEAGAATPPHETMLMERASLPLANAAIGDEVQIEMENGKTRTMVISGTTHDMNKMPAAFVGMTYGYITFDTLEWLGYPRDYNELQLLVDSADPAVIGAVVAAAEAKVEKSGRTVVWTWEPEPGKHPADDIVQPMLTVLVVLGTLSLALSAFLVVNTISAMLGQQVRQVGVMKTIGAETKQITALYLVTVLIFCLLALGVAVPLGAVAAYAFTQFLADIINFDLVGFRIPPSTLALEIGAGLIVPLVAAVYPIVSSTRITVREAISSYGAGSDGFGDDWIDRMVERVRGLSRPLLLSLRNTFRRKARLALTLFTLTLAGAIFIAVFNVRASLLVTLDEFAGFWNYDVLVTFNRLYRVEQVTQVAQGVAEVTGAESWGNAAAVRVRPDGKEGPNFDILAPPPDSDMIRPLLSEGRWFTAEDGNALVVDSDILENEPDLRVGDSVTLKLNGRESEWRIVGIAKPTISGNVLRFGTAYMPFEANRQVVRHPAQVNNVRVTLQDNSPVAQLRMAATLERAFTAAGVEVLSTRTTQSVRDAIEYQFNILVVFLSMMAAMLAVVGALGLAGIMSMNVIERAREIGVMRAIGASDSAVLQIFMVEGTLIGLISYPLSLLLAVPISYGLSQVLGVQFIGSPLVYQFSTEGAVGWMVGAVGLAAFASYLPARNAARMTVREVLAYE
jgi:putative ABC transport system permease protein